MNFNQKIVTKIPLEELWNNNGLIEAHKIKYLTKEEIKELIRDEVQFIIARISNKINWMEKDLNFELWKSELQDHICYNLEGCRLEEFEGEYFYYSSLWIDTKNAKIILFEMYH